MQDMLSAYLSRFTILSEAEREDIAARIPVHAYKKGEILLSAGDIAGKCYFVLKGCVRQYDLVDGEEKTIAFFTEEQAVVPFSSYTQQIPARYSFVCAEDCVLIVGEMGHEKAMYQAFPLLESITRLMMEQDYGKTQEEFATFITSSPEQRYLHLLDTRPELLNRVPQHQLASYLGVTPESLSRIRKRILMKK